MEPNKETVTNTPTNPSHYNLFPYQPLEYIKKLDLGFCAGNIIKYVTRCRLKNGAEDVDKAASYLEEVPVIDQFTARDGMFREALKYNSENEICYRQKYIILVATLMVMTESQTAKRYLAEELAGLAQDLRVEDDQCIL